MFLLPLSGRLLSCLLASARKAAAWSPTHQQRSSLSPLSRCGETSSRSLFRPIRPKSVRGMPGVAPCLTPTPGSPPTQSTTSSTSAAGLPPRDSATSTDAASFLGGGGCAAAGDAVDGGHQAPPSPSLVVPSVKREQTATPLAKRVRFELDEAKQEREDDEMQLFRGNKKPAAAAASSAPSPAALQAGAVSHQFSELTLGGGASSSRGPASSSSGAQAAVERDAAKQELALAEAKLAAVKGELATAEAKLAASEAKRDAALAEWRNAPPDDKATFKVFLDTAQRGVDTAQRGVDTAQRGVDTAQRGVDTAQLQVDAFTKAFLAAQEAATASQRQRAESPLHELSLEEAAAFVHDLGKMAFVVNALDESDESHIKLLGPLYDPRHKWPIIDPGVIDMRLFERATMVRPDGEALDAMRPPARKLSEMMKTDRGTSVYSFIVRMSL